MRLIIVLVLIVFSSLTYARKEIRNIERFGSNTSVLSVVNPFSEKTTEHNLIISSGSDDLLYFKILCQPFWNKDRAKLFKVMIKAKKNLVRTTPPRDDYIIFKIDSNEAWISPAAKLGYQYLVSYPGYDKFSYNQFANELLDGKSIIVEASAARPDGLTRFKLSGMKKALKEFDNRCNKIINSIAPPSPFDDAFEYLPYLD